MAVNSFNAQNPPVTTKGDVFTFSTIPTRLGVGANNTVLTADSAEATGLKWAAPDPLTTKGDLFTYSTTEARLAVGANGTVLTADSAEATGLKWATPSSGSLTSIATGTFSSNFITISSIPTTYTSLFLTMNDLRITTGNSYLEIRLNGDSTNDTYNLRTTSNTYSGIRFNDTNNVLGTSSTSGFFGYVTIENYTSTNSLKMGVAQAQSTVSTGPYWSVWSKGSLRTSAITSLEIVTSASTFTNGTYTLYGVK